MLLAFGTYSSEAEKKQAASRKDAKAQRLAKNNCSVFFFAPLREMLLLACPAASNRISIGINEPDLAQIQLTDAGFDFGTVADHHPDEIVRMDHLLGGSIQIACLQRADLARHGVVIVVRPAELHQVGDGGSDGVQCLARPWQRESLIRLDPRQLLSRRRPVRQDRP